MHNNEPLKRLDDDAKNAGQIATFQKRLRYVWAGWLMYRGIILPMLLSTFLSSEPDRVGGIAWQLMWLIPALLFTPWAVKGKSPYALLLGSMVTLVYLGASGVVLFSRFYDNGIEVWWVYAIDTVLLLLINLWLFKLLKVLPSMNKAINE